MKTANAIMSGACAFVLCLLVSGRVYDWPVIAILVVCCVGNFALSIRKP